MFEALDSEERRMELIINDTKTEYIRTSASEAQRFISDLDIGNYTLKKVGRELSFFKS